MDNPVMLATVTGAEFGAGAQSEGEIMRSDEEEQNREIKRKN